MKYFYFFIPLQLIWKIEIYEEINFLVKRKRLYNLYSRKR